MRYLHLRVLKWTYKLISENVFKAPEQCLALRKHNLCLVLLGSIPRTALIFQVNCLAWKYWEVSGPLCHPSSWLHFISEHHDPLSAIMIGGVLQAKVTLFPWVLVTNWKQVGSALTVKSLRSAYKFPEPHVDVSGRLSCFFLVIEK